MSFLLGKIYRKPNKYEGPPTTTTSGVGDAMRRHIHLCYYCELFCPDNPSKQCPTAARQKQLSDERHTGVAVVRCGDFRPKPGIEVHEVRAFNYGETR